MKKWFRRVHLYLGLSAGLVIMVSCSTGAKVRATFKPIHTGSIGGLPSKIAATIVCLLGTSFPITGIVMWMNRIKKTRKARTEGIKDKYLVVP